MKKSIIILTILICCFMGCGEDNDPLVVGPTPAPPAIPDIDPSDPTANDLVVIPEGKGFNKLSEYNLFKGDLSDLTPNREQGVIPYDLNMPLFSDYALKKRFIYVPDNQTIGSEVNGNLNFPTGTVLVKTFYFLNPDNTNQIIETRLLIKRNEEWQPEIYEWDKEHQEGIRTVVGNTKELLVNVNKSIRQFNYLIPNQNQCINCHASEGKIIPIGPKSANLNRMYEYEEGNENQLIYWNKNKILQISNIDTVNRYPKMEELTSSLESRSRAYLDVNCGSCHSRKGSAENSGLYLEYENQDSLSLGFYKTPVAAGNGSGGLTYVIKPGVGDESILLYRMIAEEIDERMPEIGRELIHDEGVTLIKEWIDSL